MNHRYLRSLLPITLLIATTIGLRAQLQVLVPFASQAGVATAAAKAVDSVGPDAQLAFIVTLGNLSQSPLPLEFNLDDGKATAWSYVFTSASAGQSGTFGVVQVPLIGFLSQSIGQALPLPAQLDVALDTSGAYASSTQMIGRLKLDTAFQRYRAQFPGMKPAVITLGQLLQADTLSLPNGFPLGEAAWTLTFTGGGDSSMTCFVASHSGAHFCRRLAIPADVVPGYEGVAGTAALDVLPNPANGHTRITLTLPEGARAGAATRFELFDERGARVRDLAPSFAVNDFRFATFDATGLPAGLYYCRAVGENWRGSTGIIVEK